MPEAPGRVPLGENHKDLPDHLYLGFDFGACRTGVAVGQTLTGGATPLITLNTRNGKPDWPAISALVEEWRPSTLVVGQPGDTHNPSLARFCRQLAGRFDLPVHTVNEDYTSTEAYQRLKAQRPGRRKPVDKTEIDQLAAVILLEAWMAEQQ